MRFSQICSKFAIGFTHNVIILFLNDVANSFGAGTIAKWSQLNDIVKDFPEVFRYTRTGPNVPRLEATSQDLADQTYEKFLGKDGKIAYDIVGQECHGVTAIAGNPWDAFEHIERVEHICKIVLAAS